MMQKNMSKVAWKSSCYLLKPIREHCLSFLDSDSVAFQRLSFSSMPMTVPLQQQSVERQSVPSSFVKWTSLGFCRGSRFATGFTPLQPKPIDSIIDIERAKLLSHKELVSVWDDPILCDSYVERVWLHNNVSPRNAFSINRLLILEMPHMLFTGLEDYKARGTQAAPYFTVTYYTEFAESRDVVLIRGDIVFTSKLNDEEAQWLLETAHSFYLNDTRYKLVECFNKRTQDFEFKDVLKALDMPTG